MFVDGHHLYDITDGKNSVKWWNVQLVNNYKGKYFNKRSFDSQQKHARGKRLILVTYTGKQG